MHHRVLGDARAATGHILRDRGDKQALCAALWHIAYIRPGVCSGRSPMEPVTYQTTLTQCKFIPMVRRGMVGGDDGERLLHPSLSGASRTSRRCPTRGMSKLASYRSTTTLSLMNVRMSECAHSSKVPQDCLGTTKADASRKSRRPVQVGTSDHLADSSRTDTTE